MEMKKLQKLKESLTQISFDSMKDSFVSDLMDMSKSAQDFADDFAEMMQKALLSYSMEDLINGDLKKLYDDWAKAIKDNDGKLTETDIEAFNKRYDDIVQEGLKRRDEWAKVTGYTGSSSSSQTATSGGWASMGQDTADELNGRFTALQIAGETIAQSMTTTVSQMLQEYFAGNRLTNAHNELLTMLVNFGIVGTMSYYGIYISYLHSMMKNDRNPYGLSIGIAVACYVIHNMVSFANILNLPFLIVLLAMGQKCCIISYYDQGK